MLYTDRFLIFSVTGACVVLKIGYPITIELLSDYVRAQDLRRRREKSRALSMRLNRPLFYMGLETINMTTLGGGKKTLQL